MFNLELKELTQSSFTFMKIILKLVKLKN